MNKLILSATLAFLYFDSCFSQQSCFELINSANAISLAESFQFVWIGTEDEGLYRYDKFSGTNVQFTPDNSDIPDIKVVSVFIYGGVPMFSTDSATCRISNGIVEVLNDSIGGQLNYAPNGGLAVVGGANYYEWNQGNVVYHQNLLELVDFSCDLCENTTDVERAIDGTLWMTHYGFYEYDIVRYDGNGWENHDINSDADIPIESFSDLNRLMVYNDQVYASTAGRILSYNGDWTYLNLANSPSIIIGSDTIGLAATDMEPDHEHGYWIGTYHVGSEHQSRLGYFNGSDWNLFPLPQGVLTNVSRITASVTDPNVLFVSTDQGTYKVDKSCLNIPSHVGQLEVEDVMRICPNPTFGLVHLDEGVTADVEVINTLGKRVLPIFTAVNSVDISELTPGIYILRVKADNVVKVAEVLLVND